MTIRAQVYPIVKGEIAFGFSVGVPSRLRGSVLGISIDFLKWHFTFDIYRG